MVLPHLKYQNHGPATPTEGIAVVAILRESRGGTWSVTRFDTLTAFACSQVTVEVRNLRLVTVEICTVRLFYKDTVQDHDEDPKVLSPGYQAWLRDQFSPPRSWVVRAPEDAVRYAERASTICFASATV